MSGIAHVALPPARRRAAPRACPCAGCPVWSSQAAAPPAGTQAPGWYRYKVGSIEVTVVTDGARFKVPDDHVGTSSETM